jgi:hypothetical protein
LGNRSRQDGKKDEEKEKFWSNFWEQRRNGARKHEETNAPVADIATKQERTITISITI